MTTNFFQNRHGTAQHEPVLHPLFARALDELYWPNACETTYLGQEKQVLYDDALKTIPKGPITYLEFGVYGGWSFEHIRRRFNDLNSRFYGFDSFMGLPEQWHDAMKVGHFSTEGEAPKPNDSRAQFIKGWFQNTVPGFLKENPPSGNVLVHFDADLYSSTLFLLTTLWHNIRDYWFIFDEFQPDEIIALHDFSRAYPVEMQFISCTVSDRNIPQQMFGRLRNIPFAP